jgi:hypothetical protein
MKTKKSDAVAPAIPEYFDPADLREIERLCVLAAKLGVPIVTPRRCPDSGERNWKNIAGMYISVGGRIDRDLRSTLKLLNVTPPVIVLRTQVASTLGHEIGHHVTMFDVMIDKKMDRRVSPLLHRLCEQHGIRYYGDDNNTQLAEIRAECIGRRLLGKTLPATLRRFTARAWGELQRKTKPTRRDPGRKK